MLEPDTDQFSFTARTHPKVSDKRLQVNYGVLKNVYDQSLTSTATTDLPL